MAAIFGDQDARALLALTNVLIWFGGSKDVAFNQEVSDLVGKTRVQRSTWQFGGRRGRGVHSEDAPILLPQEIRQLPERQALIIAENARPIIVSLYRCLDGRPGHRLQAAQQALRQDLADGVAIENGPQVLTVPQVGRQRV